MLYAGSDDGVYRIAGIEGPGDDTAERVLEARRVFRVRTFEWLDGLFVTAESGLYHSSDGLDWTTLPHPADEIYSVGASPSGDRLYTGTRPARVFIAELTEDGLPGGDDWVASPGFDALRDRVDWGLPRHDGLAQVRSLATHPDAPDRIVAGVEVGGIHVSEDRGSTWTNRSVSGFEAPHTDDIHHLTLADAGTIVASTGSGLYRSTDLGRDWERLDTGFRQRYFREAFVHDGVIYAGAAPGPSTTWDEDDDHVLGAARDGGHLEPEPSPTPHELPIGWCVVARSVVAATHRGTLLRSGDDGWSAVGAVPTTDRVRGRYLPLAWYEAE